MLSWLCPWPPPWPPWKRCCTWARAEVFWLKADGRSSRPHRLITQLLGINSSYHFFCGQLMLLSHWFWTPVISSRSRLKNWKFKGVPWPQLLKFGRFLGLSKHIHMFYELLWYLFHDHISKLISKLRMVLVVASFEKEHPKNDRRCLDRRLKAGPWQAWRHSGQGAHVEPKGL